MEVEESFITVKKKIRFLPFVINRSKREKSLGQIAPVLPAKTTDPFEAYGLVPKTFQ